jgi:hypothetical protein
VVESKDESSISANLDEQPIHFCLKYFLTLFSLNHEFHDVMEQAFFSTLNTLFKAPIFSQLKLISSEEAARTMVDILQNMDKRAGEGVNQNMIQESIAWKILGEMQNQEAQEEDRAKTYSKALTWLELPLERFVAVRSLMVAATKVAQVTTSFVFPTLIQ